MTLLRIGTRGSMLARWQADYVRQALLEAHPGLSVELVVIRTSGDAVQDKPLTRIGGTGVFTKEIENALLDERVDVAVHSLKDLPCSKAEGGILQGLPTESAKGLRLAAIPAREDPADALISRDGRGLAELPAGAMVLTGSPRRRAQLLHRRPDLKIGPGRGNVQTRLRKFEESEASGIMLAMAGLIRLELAGRVAERLDPTEFLPACGQGALAVETRAEDKRTAELCGALEDRATRLATTAERAFLSALGGGCLAPVGAYGRAAEKGRLALTGMAASLNGARMIRRTVEGQADGLSEGGGARRAARGYAAGGGGGGNPAGGRVGRGGAVGGWAMNFPSVVFFGLTFGPQARVQARLPGVGKLGDWEIGRLGDSGIRGLGDWETCNLHRRSSHGRLARPPCGGLALPGLPASQDALTIGRGFNPCTQRRENPFFVFASREGRGGDERKGIFTASLAGRERGRSGPVPQSGTVHC